MDSNFVIWEKHGSVQKSCSDCEAEKWVDADQLCYGCKWKKQEHERKKKKFPK